MYTSWYRFDLRVKVILHMLGGNNVTPLELFGEGNISLYVASISVMGSAQKKDHLWVKWVNGVYLRGTTWFDYSASSSSTWAWKRICRIKNTVRAGNVGNWWLKEGNSYTVSQGYMWRCPGSAPVRWHQQVWNRICLPKHSFINWLFVLGRLQTKLRMNHLGYSGDLLCFLCAAATESSTHLFFECPYSAKCVQVVASKLGMYIPVTGTWLWWEQTGFSSAFHKTFVGASLCALIYRIWLTRNHSLHNGVLVRPIWTKSLIPELVFRCKSVVNSKLIVSHGQWLSNM
ncbi:hypothetical protein RND81_14G209300 [Saponaria officinalis]|uniref:Reverse transcriptase zinc-binding domain-containing protein n=1 Tax=Saponaria officinalis TaxID=3572 RepID=A0AAW1GTF3_SAPOF